jgi:hypothetical protein
MPAAGRLFYMAVAQESRRVTTARHDSIRSLKLNIQRVPTAGGTPQLIANNVGLIWYVVSSSANGVAYTGSKFNSDTIHVVDVTPAVREVAPPLGTPAEARVGGE